MEPELNFSEIVRFLDLTKEDVMQQVLNRVDLTINKLDGIKGQVNSIIRIVERGEADEQRGTSEMMEEENLALLIDETVKEGHKEKEEENEQYASAIKMELNSGLVDLKEECGKAKKQINQTERGVETRLKQSKDRLLADMEQIVNQNKEAEREMKRQVEQLSQRMRLGILQEQIKRKEQKQVLLARISDI